MRTPSRLAVVASVGLLVMLQGCTSAPGTAPGSDSSIVDSISGPEPSTVEGPPEILDTGNAAAWCDLVPPALVEATLDTQVQDPTATFSTEEVHCTYLPVDEGGLMILVQYLLGRDHTSFVEDRDNASEPTFDLAGVGDEAYYTSSDFGTDITNTVVARKGSVVVIIGAPKALEQVTDLVNQALAMLL